MGNLETPITWVLGIAFIAYVGLGNCCTDSGNQAAYGGTEVGINAPALEVEQAPPPVEVTIEDSDTTVVVDTELITEEEE
jgi:hypothetical protein